MVEGSIGFKDCKIALVQMLARPQEEGGLAVVKDRLLIPRIVGFYEPGLLFKVQKNSVP